jgi:hypothetical protein
MLQVLTGLPPFSHIRQNQAVMLEVVVMKRRPRAEPTHSPLGVSYTPLWDVVAACWANDASARPPIQRVHTKLIGLP